MKNGTIGNTSNSSINLTGDKVGDKAGIKGTVTETSNRSGTVLSEGMNGLVTSMSVKGQLKKKIPCLHSNNLGKQVSMLERLNVTGWGCGRVRDDKSKVQMVSDVKYPLFHKKQYGAKVQRKMFIQPSNGGGEKIK